MAETSLKNEIETISLHKIPTGKHSFIATVIEKTLEDEYDYWGNEIAVPYLHLTKLQVQLDLKWYNVDTAGVKVFSKIGKKLEKLNLETMDLISFDAHVEEKLIDFDPYDEQTIPKDYDNPTFLLEYYYAVFNTWNGQRIQNGEKRKSYRFDNIHELHTFNRRENGYFREWRQAYYRGKKLKNFSAIEKYS